MTPHLEMKSTKILQEEKVWFGIFCELFGDRASWMTTDSSGEMGNNETGQKKTTAFSKWM